MRDSSFYNLIFPDESCVPLLSGEPGPSFLLWDGKANLQHSVTMKLTKPLTEEISKKGKQTIGHEFIQLMEPDSRVIYEGYRPCVCSNGIDIGGDSRRCEPAVKGGLGESFSHWCDVLGADRG